MAGTLCRMHALPDRACGYFMPAIVGRRAIARGHIGTRAFASAGACPYAVDRCCTGDDRCSRRRRNERAGWRCRASTAEIARNACKGLPRAHGYSNAAAARMRSSTAVASDKLERRFRCAKLLDIGEHSTRFPAQSSAASPRGLTAAIRRAGFKARIVTERQPSVAALVPQRVPSKKARPVRRPRNRVSHLQRAIGRSRLEAMKPPRQVVPRRRQPRPGCWRRCAATSQDADAASAHASVERSLPGWRPRAIYATQQRHAAGAEVVASAEREPSPPW